MYTREQLTDYTIHIITGLIMQAIPYSQIETASEKIYGTSICTGNSNFTWASPYIQIKGVVVEYVNLLLGSKEEFLKLDTNKKDAIDDAVYILEDKYKAIREDEINHEMLKANKEAEDLIRRVTEIINFQKNKECK